VSLFYLSVYSNGPLKFPAILEPMETAMTKRVIEHEIKLQKPVIVILAVLAIGVCANALAPVFDVKEASALLMGSQPTAPIYIKCVGGCR